VRRSCGVLALGGALAMPVILVSDSFGAVLAVAVNLTVLFTGVLLAGRDLTWHEAGVKVAARARALYARILLGPPAPAAALSGAPLREGSSAHPRR
jgi:hypothetical protein